MLSPGAQVDRLVSRITRQLQIPLHLLPGTMRDRVRHIAIDRLSQQPDVPVSQLEIKAIASAVQMELAASTPTAITPSALTPVRPKGASQRNGTSSGTCTANNNQSISGGGTLGPAMRMSSIAVHQRRSRDDSSCRLPEIASPRGGAIPPPQPPVYPNPSTNTSARRPPAMQQQQLLHQQATDGMSTTTRSIPEMLGEEIMSARGIQPDSIPKGLKNSNSIIVEKKLMRMLREREWAEKYKADAQKEKDAIREARQKRIAHAEEAKLILEAQAEAREKAKADQRREEALASKELLLEMDRRDLKQLQRERARTEREHKIRLQLDGQNEAAQREREEAKKADMKRETDFIQSVVERELEEKAAAAQKRYEKRVALKEYLSGNSDVLSHKRMEKQAQVDRDKAYVEQQRRELGLREVESLQQIHLETPRGLAFKQRTQRLADALLSEQEAKEAHIKQEEAKQAQILAARLKAEDDQRLEEIAQKKRSQLELAAALDAQQQRQAQQSTSNGGNVILSGRRATHQSSDAIDPLLTHMTTNRDRSRYNKQLAVEAAKMHQQQIVEKRRREAKDELAAAIGR